MTCKHVWQTKVKEARGTFSKREGGPPVVVYGEYQVCLRCSESRLIPWDKNLRTVYCERLEVND